MIKQAAATHREGKDDSQQSFEYIAIRSCMNPPHHLAFVCDGIKHSDLF